MKCIVALLSIVYFFVAYQPVFGMEQKSGDSAENLVVRKQRVCVNNAASMQNELQLLLDNGQYEDVINMFTKAIHDRCYDNCVPMLIRLMYNHFFLIPKFYRRVGTTGVIKTMVMLGLSFRDEPNILAQGGIICNRPLERVRNFVISTLQKTHEQITVLSNMLTLRARESECKEVLNKVAPESILGCGVNGHFSIQ